MTFLKHMNPLRLVSLGLLAAVPGVAMADKVLNLTQGATPYARTVYNLHMLIMNVCIAIGVVVFGLIFYFLILRPQNQRAKKHKSFLESLGVGSRVVLNSGLFGKIVALEGNEAKIEIADRVVVRVLRSQIAGLETNAAEAVAEATAGK